MFFSKTCHSERSEESLIFLWKSRLGKNSQRCFAPLNMTGCLDYEIGCTAFDDGVNQS